jgi:mono/diheme cytochrome c family protein
MRVFLKMTLFTLIIVSAFLYYGNSIPQISNKDTGPIEIGESPEELVEAGKLVFEKENSCLTCHSIGADPKARCPDQENVAVLAAERKPGMSAVEYLVEAVYAPNAHIVEGYQKNQMKPVNKPPLALSDDEIKAVLCYLISLSIPVDVESVRAIEAAQAPYKSGKIQVAEEAQEIDLGFPQDEEELAYMIEDGQQTYADMKCWQCHSVKGVDWSEFTDVEITIDEANIGPDLSNMGGIQNPQYILESLITPSAIIVAPMDVNADEAGKSKMPDYHDTLTLRQLIDLMAYLVSLKGGGDDGNNQ